MSTSQEASLSLGVFIYFWFDCKVHGNCSSLRFQVKILTLTLNKYICLLPVVESDTSCTAEPVVTGETPQEDTTLFVLPYEEVKFNVKFLSQQERFVTFLV